MRIMVLNEFEVKEIDAWANILQALGQPGHDRANDNQLVLREITKLVKERLEAITK